MTPGEGEAAQPASPSPRTALILRRSLGSPALFALSLPFAISFSTSISRSDSSVRIVSAISGCELVARTRCSTLPAM